MLEPLAVSADAEAVYRLLLSGPLTAAELRLFTRLTPVEMRRHLSELAVRGLVVRDSNGVFQARSAQRLLESATRRQQALSLRQAAQRTMRASKLIVEAIRDVCAAPENTEAERIESRSGVIANLTRFSAACRHETMRVTAPLPQGWLREHGHESGMLMQMEASTFLRSGMSSREIVHASIWQSFNTHRAVRDGLRAVIRAGRQFRTGAVANVPQLTIFDRRVALLPLAPVPGSSPGGYIVRDPAFAQRLAAAFDDFWVGSFTADLPNFGGELNPAQRTVIEALAGGASDDAMARKLGLSRRTVARVVAELMTIAGTTSRFQLGVEAIARGWLPGSREDRLPAQRSEAIEPTSRAQEMLPLASSTARQHT